MQLDAVLTTFTIYPGFTAGYLDIPFAAFSQTPPFDQAEARQEIQRRLNEIPEVSIRDKQIEKYPGVPIIALAEPNAFERFVSTIDWVLRDVLSERH